MRNKKLTLFNESKVLMSSNEIAFGVHKHTAQTVNFEVGTL